MSTADCPSRNVLLAYQTGELSETVAGSVTSHVVCCEACQAELNTIRKAEDTFAARLRASSAEEPYLQEPGCAAAVVRVKVAAGSLAVSAVSAAAIGAVGGELGRLGEYELLQKLGEGGMGTVYRARQVNLDRVVALKVLPQGATQDQRAVSRFYREMKAVGRVDHPNIVRAMDAREIDGKPVLVMEYVAGLNLHDVVALAGPLRLADACELILQAARGLQCVHENALVHRDIKPSNLMLSPQGQVKILDLGLALLQVEQPGGEMTGSGQAMGTADYIAPEQVSDSHNVDIRADVYSLGCTLYKLLTGHSPFSGPEYKGDFHKMLGHLQKPIKPLRDLRPDVPEELAAIVHRMLAKNPADRFATPAEVTEAMITFTAGSDLAALIAKATGRPRAPAIPDPARGSTIEVVSSASAGTWPSKSVVLQEEVKAPEPLSLPEKMRERRHVLRHVKWVRVAATAMLAGIAGAILLGIIIKIRPKDGPEITVHTGDDTTLSVEKDGTRVTVFPVPTKENEKSPSTKPPSAPVTTGQPTARPKPESINLTPEPLDIKPGAPISKTALVQQPASISGLRSWTIETIGHRDGVASLKYSPDARVLATGSQDGTIRLWEAKTVKFLRAIVAHDGPITGITWSPNGKMLASAGADKSVRIWDVETGRRLLTLSGTEAFLTVGWSPAGRFLAAGGWERLHLWKFSDGEADGSVGGRIYRDDWRPVARGIAERLVPSFGGGCRQSFVAWRPDGKALATRRYGSVILLDPESCEVIASRERHVPGAAWSPDGTELVLGGGENSVVRFWNTQSDTERECPLEGALGWVLALAPDARTLAFCKPHTGGLCVLDAREWKIRYSRGEGRRRAFLTCDFASDGTDLAYGDGCGEVGICEAASGRMLDALPSHTTFVSHIAWSADQTTIATWGKRDNGRPIHVVDSASGELRREIPSRYCVSSIAWSPSGNALGWATDYGVEGLEAWDNRSATTKTYVRGEPYGRLAWSPEGKRLAAAGDWEARKEQEGRVWDATSGKEMCKLPAGRNGVAYSPDGRRLAVGEERAIKVCDAETGQVHLTLPPAQGPLSVLSWSPDGKTLAAGCTDKSVCLFDVDGKRISSTCAGHKAIPEWLCWPDSGKTLLSTSESETCTWDAASGRLQKTVPADAAQVQYYLSVPVPHVFSPDGRLTASGGASLVRLRRTDDGQLMRTLLDLRNQQHAAVSPDGHFRGSPDVETEFVYVAVLDSGEQTTLTPQEFSKKYGWKNDPAKVPLGMEVAALTRPAVPPETAKPAPAAPSARPKTITLQLTPEPLDIKPGEPMSKAALVGQPAAIPGVRSWTIETVGHRGSDAVVAYSPDGRYLATSCSDETIRLWDGKSHKFLRAIVAHDASISGICWSPDGKILASAGRDRTVRLLDPESGRRLLTLRGEEDFLSVAWSPNGRLLAASMSTRLQLWEFSAAPRPGTDAMAPRKVGWRRVASGLITLVIDQGGFVTLLWSHDSKRLFAGRSGTIGLVYNVETASLRPLDYVSPYSTCGMTRSPDGRTATFTGKPITVRDAETGQVLREFPAGVEADRSVAWSPDGKRLAGGGNHFPGYPRFLAVWDADTGKDLFHFSERPIRSLAYSPNGDLLAAGTVSGRVEMWEAVSGVELDGLPAHQGWRPIVCWSPDGKALACAGSSWLRVQAIESGSGRVLREASTITQELVGATAWSNDPDLLTYANGNHAFVWRLSSGEEWGFQGPGNFAPCSSSWSPDGRTIAAGNYRGEAEILELTKPEPKRTPVGAKAKTLAFSPDGKALAVAEDREAKLCDPKSGKVVEVLGAAGAPIGNLSWSPDGKLIATSCEDKKLYVFDVSGKRLAATCQGHQEQAISLGWSEDGKTLISGSASEVCVWDAASGKLLRTIADDGGAISRDGRLVAARGHSAVRIRQIDDGRLLRTLMSLRDQQYAAVSPEGHFRGSPDVEKEFVYVVQTDNGQETLTPEEFSKRFGWKNDSSRVELTAETKSADAKAKPEKKAEAAKTQQANPAK